MRERRVKLMLLVSIFPCCRLLLRYVHHNPTSEQQPRTLVGVTPKQHKALSLVLERGYFQVSRESSAGELGEELDISRQAFSRRLQRGQQSVFTDLLTDHQSA